MKLTVKELKRKIENLHDDTEVFIERVEDIYFEHHNWTTERLVFSADKDNIPLEYVDYFGASQAYVTKDKKLIIGAHY
jgi:hypothetical protein